MRCGSGATGSTPSGTKRTWRTMSTTFISIRFAIRSYRRSATGLTRRFMLTSGEARCQRIGVDAPNSRCALESPADLDCAALHPGYSHDLDYASLHPGYRQNRSPDEAERNPGATMKHPSWITLRFIQATPMTWITLRFIQATADLDYAALQPGCSATARPRDDPKTITIGAGPGP